MIHLGSVDVIDAAIVGAELRQDRAPKEELQKALENTPNGVLGSKKNNRFLAPPALQAGKWTHAVPTRTSKSTWS